MTKLVAYFRICLYMVDRTKQLASVGLAQVRQKLCHIVIMEWPDQYDFASFGPVVQYTEYSYKQVK